jgi:hypothetical protein
VQSRSVDQKSSDFRTAHPEIKIHKARIPDDASGNHGFSDWISGNLNDSSKFSHDVSYVYTGII